MPCRTATTSILAAACLAGLLLLGLARPTGAPAATPDPCVRAPSTGPLWIEYGEAGVPKEVRDVFSRPGVTVATSGTTLPPQYRERGAATVHFVLKLPRWIGTPGNPMPAESIDGGAGRVYDMAVASTGCATPIIGLNELLGPSAAVPWSDNVRAYRANVLAFVGGLAARGARPALFIHGSPGFTGEAVDWWRAIGATADVVYESYFKAPTIDRLGRILGPRRMRLNMRSVVAKFVKVGVPRDRLGLALGFQVRPGTQGREGLQPSESWFRYVKWNALAARQVATEARLATIWSWGWGNLHPLAVDPDKPRAACVYLWARDQRLCDGRTVAGDRFNASLTEGAIVIPPGVTCVSVAGKLRTRGIDELTRLTRSRSLALDALFARAALAPRYPVDEASIDAVEADVIVRAFAGSPEAYEAELVRLGATREVARGAIADELRRRQIAESGASPLAVSADVTGNALDTTTCVKDVLPGVFGFPRTERREIGAVPLLSFLPFLFADLTPPAAPTGATLAVVGSSKRLAWTPGVEADLAGYVVERTTPEGAVTRLTPVPLPRPAFFDNQVTREGTTYAVRAVDTSGNVSAPAPALPPEPLPAEPVPVTPAPAG